MTTTSFEEALPVELWHQILSYILPGDLCNVVLTSKYMYNVASYPNLWNNMQVNMKMIQKNGLSQFYSINRFKKITKMEFSYMDLSFDEIKQILKDIPGSPLKDVNLSSIYLSEVSEELLVGIVGHMQTINLSNTFLQPEQCIKLLEAIHSSKTLVDLKMAYISLNEVPEEILAKAVSRLQKLDISNSWLTIKQKVIVLEAASLSSSKLVDLNLTNITLQGVSPELLANAIYRLKSVNLPNTNLLPAQCVKVLEATLKSSTVVNLNLMCVNLSEVPAELLAQTVGQIKTVNLYGTNLETEQCVKLFKAILLSNRLINFDIGGVYLNDVPLELLTRVVNHVPNIILH